jgi:hypothetical protein
VMPLISFIALPTIWIFDCHSWIDPVRQRGELDNGEEKEPIPGSSDRA